jgi:tetratricopeptide (TPR) repeat protein
MNCIHWRPEAGAGDTPRDDAEALVVVRRTGLRFTLLSMALAVLAAPVTAQRAKKPAPEFTKQSMLIVNFAPGPGADLRFARDGANAVRSRAAKLINNKQEVEVIDDRDVTDALWRSGFNPDSAYALAGLRALARQMRADEIVLGTVSRSGKTAKISGEIVLTRDEKMRQPIPEVSAPRLDSAAMLFARALHAARAQLTNERRCENALHDGDGQRAIATTREAIAAYPRSTVARMCLVYALHETRAPAAEVLAVTRQVLAIDSNNVHAIEYAAIALDSLKQRDEAAKMWLRFARTDTADMDLAVRVAFALSDGGNTKTAEEFTTRLAKEHPDEIRFHQQKWRAAYDNRSWPHALEAGEALLEHDPVARGDSTFYLKLATVYRASDMPLKAIEILARGVGMFPKDSRLYSLYAQSVRAEADTVIPRGLGLFPKSADLAVMNAKDLKARGKVAESLDATKHAVELDSTMAQGRLMIAQLEIELGRPDSALVTLKKAVMSGEDSALVAQFALSKGNTLYRAANSTKASNDFLLAYRYLTFADTVKSTMSSKFLIGATALGVAQAALTEASKVPDKTEACRLVHLGADMVPIARTGLTAGTEAFGDAAKQSLDYLTELEQYVGPSTTAACGAAPPGQPVPPGQTR